MFSSRTPKSLKCSDGPLLKVEDETNLKLSSRLPYGHVAESVRVSAFWSVAIFVYNKVGLGCSKPCEKWSLLVFFVFYPQQAWGPSEGFRLFGVRDENIF